jgi:hypothetical protein
MGSSACITHHSMNHSTAAMNHHFENAKQILGKCVHLCTADPNGSIMYTDETDAVRRSASIRLAALHILLNAPSMQYHHHLQQQQQLIMHNHAQLYKQYIQAPPPTLHNNCSYYHPDYNQQQYQPDYSRHPSQWNHTHDIVQQHQLSAYLLLQQQQEQQQQEQQQQYSFYQEQYSTLSKTVHMIDRLHQSYFGPCRTAGAA